MLELKYRNAFKEVDEILKHTDIYLVNEIPKKFIVRCVQNRRQVTGLVASLQTLKSGVLYLQDSIRSQDFDVCTHNVAERYQELPNVLSDYISAAEDYKNSR